MIHFNKNGFRAGLKKHVLPRLITPIAVFVLGGVSAAYNGVSFGLKLPICLAKYTFLVVVPVKVDGRWCSVGSCVPDNFGAKETCKHGIKAVVFLVEAVACPVLSVASPSFVIWLNVKAGLVEIAKKSEEKKTGMKVLTKQGDETRELEDRTGSHSLDAGNRELDNDSHLKGDTHHESDETLSYGLRSEINNTESTAGSTSLSNKRIFDAGGSDDCSSSDDDDYWTSDEDDNANDWSSKTSGKGPSLDKTEFENFSSPSDFLKAFSGKGRGTGWINAFYKQNDSVQKNSSSIEKRETVSESEEDDFGTRSEDGEQNNCTEIVEDDDSGIRSEDSEQSDCVGIIEDDDSGTRRKNSEQNDCAAIVEDDSEKIYGAHNQNSRSNYRVSVKNLAQRFGGVANPWEKNHVVYSARYKESNPLDSHDLQDLPVNKQKSFPSDDSSEEEWGDGLDDFNDSGDAKSQITKEEIQKGIASIVSKY